jgi:hypothetical protein
VPVTFTDAAFEALTVNVSVLPGLIELCAAEIETVGAGVPDVTVTVVCDVALPLEFVAVAVYVVVEVGATVIFPPLYGSVYEVPFDPVTWIDAALVSVTVRVSVCPDEMLLELAVIETVGTAAAALVAKTETTTKERKRMRDRIVFTGACLVFVFFRRRLGTRLFDSREISLHFDASKAARSWSASPNQPAQFLNGPATPLKSRSKTGAENRHAPRCAKGHWQQIAHYHPTVPHPQLRDSRIAAC